MSVLEKFSLKDQIGVVTGGAGLLGRYHAKALLDAGCKVVIVDIDDDKITESSKFFHDKKGVFHKKVDITNESELIASIGNIQSEIGVPSILINNAAIDAKVDSSNKSVNNKLEAFDLERWNKEIDVGLTGAFLCSKHFGTLMAKNKRGVILNISSDLGLIAPNQNIYKNVGNAKSDFVKPVTYSVIKHGIIGLTKYLSTYWVEEGVRCNALAPGGIANNQSDEFIKNIKELIPMKRMAEVDEYQAAVIFLCSNASSYMNGSILTIDGGRTTW